MKRIIPPVVITFIFINSLYAQQWTERNTGVNEALLEIDFPSPQMGYTITGSTFLRSTDAGKTWNKVDFPQLITDSLLLFDLQFVNENTGFLAALSNYSSKKIYKTTDNGNSWTDISPLIATKGWVYKLSLHFFDSQTGILAFDDECWRTSDGGASWEKQTLGIYNCNTISFSGKDTGYVGGWDGTFSYRGIILKTTNGGQSWSQNILAPRFPRNSVIEHLSTPGPDNVFSVIYHYFIRSNDGGQSWDSIGTGMVGTIEMQDDKRGYWVSENNIYRTNDGGLSWKLEYNSTHRMAVAKLYPFGVYVIGDSGIIVQKSLINSLNKPLVSSHIRFYPNPTSGIFTIETENIPEQSILQIADGQGKIVKVLNIKTEKTIDLSNCPAGMYTYRLLSSNKPELCGKLIKN